VSLIDRPLSRLVRSVVRDRIYSASQIEPRPNSVQDEGADGYDSDSELGVDGP